MSEQRGGDPTALPTLLEAYRNALSEAGVSDESAEAFMRDRQRQARRDRLEPFRHVITDEDYKRIVGDNLDTFASEVTHRFLAAEQSNPRRKFLWLCGGMGTGKTVAALWALAEDGGRYATADEVRRAYGQEHEEARALRPRLVDCRLLIVDDVGTAKNEDEEARALFELCNARQGGRRQTIITGNLSKKDVLFKFGGRLMERVLHQGAIVDCGSEGLRRK